jgi:hypothetical protein
MALVEIEPEDHNRETRTCRIGELAPGMIIDEEIRTNAGSLIVARNQEVTPFLILKLRNYRQAGSIVGDIVVSVPKTSAAAAK